MNALHSLPDNPDDLSLELREAAGAMALAVQGMKQWGFENGEPTVWAFEGLEWLAWEVQHRAKALSDMRGDRIMANLAAKNIVPKEKSVGGTR